MGKTRPSQVSPESTVWPIECFSKALLRQELFSLCVARRLGARKSRSMSFIRQGLGLGKQVELWDSNVHKDIQIAVLKASEAQSNSQLRH
jgi:hypothetical protein